MSGLLGRVGTTSADGAWVERMAALLAHRGSPEPGHLTACEVALLTHGLGPEEGGIVNQDGAILVLAGSVKGHTPASLLSLLRDRESTPRDLRGTFVLALWEAARRRLTLIRDGAGRRTLYHAQVGPQFLFASEPKAIHQQPGFDRKLRPAAIAQYLSFSFVPGTGTMLEGIEELPPGTTLRFHPDASGGPTRERWFRPEEDAREPKDTAADWAARFRAIHRQSIRDLLPTDPATPLALFLSGGMDSSVVAAELARLRDRHTTAFSLHFGSTHESELPFAREVARQRGLAHEVVEIRPRDFAKRLADIAWHLDDPIGDPVTMPNYILAQTVAANGFRYVFNGEGGDPCFGGPKNLTMLLHHWYGVPDRHPRFRERAYLRAYRRAYTDLQNLLAPDLLAEIDEHRDLEAVLTPFFDRDHPAALLDKLLDINIRLKGAHLILPKVERMLGAHGLTPLSPLFDEAMIELSFRLPGRQKLAGGVEKVVMKTAYADRLPPHVIHRPKVGMRVPVRAWFQKELKQLAYRHLRVSKLEADGIWNSHRVHQLLAGTIEEANPRTGMRLWMILMFEIWRERVGAHR